MKIKKQYLSDIESPLNIVEYPSSTQFIEDNPLYVIYYF